MLHESVILQFIKDHTNFLLAKSALPHFGINDLLNGEFFKSIVFTKLSVTLEEIDSTSFEPCIRPLANIKVFSHDFAAIMLLVISFLETWDKVCEFCVFPGVLTEVNMKSILQSILSKNAVYLFEIRCTFTVGNAIKGGIGLVSSLNFAANWMGSF